MFSRAIFALLVVASTAFSGRCIAQVKTLGTYDGIFSGDSVNIAQESVCNYAYLMKGTLSKKLKNGEKGALKSCEFWRCTDRDLWNECAAKGMPASFSVTCHGTVTVAEDGSSVKVEVQYPKEKYLGKPKCKQWASKADNPPETYEFSTGRGPPVSTPVQGSNTGSSIGNTVSSIGNAIKCAVIGVFYKGDIARNLHPECH